MKKIMFNNKYDLTKLVLEGRKTMTRRPVSERLLQDAQVYSGGDIERRNQYLLAHAPFKVGDVVAIAQNYKDCGYDPNDFYLAKHLGELAGWSNPMFVKASLMPHRIRITNVKVERLRDISRQDILREGFLPVEYHIYEGGDEIDCKYGYTLPQWKDGIEDPWAPNNPEAWMAEEPDTALCVLLYKISGKRSFLGQNPWVFAYTFELIK